MDHIFHRVPTLKAMEQAMGHLSDKGVDALRCRTLHSMCTLNNKVDGLRISLGIHF